MVPSLQIVGMRASRGRASKSEGMEGGVGGQGRWLDVHELRMNQRG
jgi:hypothetical protein